MPSMWKFQVKYQASSSAREDREYREERQRDIIARRRRMPIMAPVDDPEDDSPDIATRQENNVNSWNEEPGTSLITEATVLTSSYVYWLAGIARTTLTGLGQQLARLRPEPIVGAQINRNMPAGDMIKILTTRAKIEDLTSRLDFRRCTKCAVGGGGFGDIFQGRLLGEDRQSAGIAIKCLRVFLEENEENKNFLKHFARELYTWSKFDHDNVLKLLGVATYNNQIAMISPWMPNGNLSQYITKNPKVDRCRLGAQAANAVAYIHDLKIAHGDIKSINFVVSESGILKLTDFGNTFVDDPNFQFTTRGTRFNKNLSLRWTAPELLLVEDSTFSLEADVYALGMTLFEIFTGEIPFASTSLDARVLWLVTRGNTPTRPESNIPTGSRDGDRLWELLTLCWSSDPKSRPSAGRVRDTLQTISQERLAYRPSTE